MDQSKLRGSTKDFSAAHLVISNHKVIKNRFGKPGSVIDLPDGEYLLSRVQDQNKEK